MISRWGISCLLQEYFKNCHVFSVRLVKISILCVTNCEHYSCIYFGMKGVFCIFKKLWSILFHRPFSLYNVLARFDMVLVDIWRLVSFFFSLFIFPDPVNSLGLAQYTTVLSTFGGGLRQTWDGPLCPPVVARQDQLSRTRLFYFYIFQKHFFTEIYFRFHNLQFYIRVARDECLCKKYFWKI